jgi:hypothetical protein
MAHISMGLGILLIALGTGGYIYTDRASMTALIPAFEGLGLLILGVLALRDNLRKHAMHTALLIALIGAGGSTVMAVLAIAKLVAGKELAHNGAGLYCNIINAVCCTAFIALGIRSFVSARRRRLEQPVT